MKALYCLHRSPRDRDHGPADRVRSRLRLHGVGRHRAGEGAFYTGAGDKGTGGLARPREPRSAGAAGDSYISALEAPGPPREYASCVLRAPGIFASAFLPLAGACSL